MSGQGLGLLNQKQRDRIKAARSQDWKDPFDVEITPEVVTTGMYDAPASPSTSHLFGRWHWLDQQERSGGPGGVITRGELELQTDEINAGLVLHPRARLVVEGIRCAVKAGSPITDNGELMIRAVAV